MTIIPSTLGQRLYFNALTDLKIPLVVVTGPAGSGKTLLASRVGATQTNTGTFKRLILTRPAVTASGEEHGFIPGTIDEKMEPWVRPVTDLIVRTKKVEVCPFAFMRGLTFDDSWVIADEMQNSSEEQMKMLLTRIGKNSKLVVTGDVTQADRKSNGLTDLIRRIHKYPMPEIKYVELSEDDILRSELVKKVLKLYM